MNEATAATVPLVVMGPVAIADRAAMATARRAAREPHVLIVPPVIVPPVIVTLATVPVAAPGPTVARARSDALVPTSRLHPSCLSVRSRGASSPAGSIETPCWPTCQKSSAPSQSVPCKADCQRYARLSTSRTNDSRPRESQRCRPAACCPWPRACYLGSESPSGWIAPMRRWPTSQSSICATYAAWSLLVKIPWSPGTRPPVRSPRS